MHIKRTRVLIVIDNMSRYFVYPVLTCFIADPYIRTRDTHAREGVQFGAMGPAKPSPCLSLRLQASHILSSRPAFWSPIKDIWFYIHQKPLCRTISKFKIFLFMIYKQFCIKSLVILIEIAPIHETQ